MSHPDYQGRLRQEIAAWRGPNQETNLLHTRPGWLDRFRQEVANYRDPNQLPPPSLFTDPKTPPAPTPTDNSYAELITETFSAFGVPVEVIGSEVGPRLTQYYLRPQSINGRRAKIKAIKALNDDLALALGKRTTITNRPGKLILEIPNDEFENVTMGDIIESEQFREMISAGGLPLALGKDTSGKPVVVDLTKMPHLLIAGATGSGKSVCMNALISSLLTAYSPKKLNFLMIDPKMVELVPYDGIRHLVKPVIKDMANASNALEWAVSQMEVRYKQLSEVRKRNIKGYNKWASENGKELMPYLVIVIDELADLMVQYKDEVETAVTRLAQMARAVGIHLILATQRPTVDVVTGLIKANVPARIAFGVSSGVNSRVILDQKGAEHLLGLGDSLYLAPDASQPIRVQGSFVSDSEIDKLVEHWSSQ